MTNRDYSIQELAEKWGVSIAHIYQLTSQRKIGFYTTGKRKGIRFTQEDIDQYVASKRRKSQRDINVAAQAHCLRKPLRLQ